MRKFKKALAFALASAMVISVVPVSAATTNSATLGKTTLYYNGTTSYKTTTVKATKKAGYTVKFVSSNKKVATVGATGGKVTAKAAGTVTIKANFYKKGKLSGTKSMKLTVKKAPAATGIGIDKSELMVGETAQMTAKGGAVYYYSADKSVVTVGKTGGKVTAKGSGSTRITVVNRITGKKKYINVTVLSDSPVATQTGSKTITVKNGVSMSDRTITVKRGTTTVALATKDGVVFSDNGKSATITTSTNLMDAEYTVTVTDTDKTEKTSTVKATAAKVSKITVLSDKAAVVKDSNNAYTKAQVGYKVENQFGEDITKSTSLSVSGTDTPELDTTNHRITFNRTGATSGSSISSYIIGRDVVSVVLVHTETGVTTSATLTVSNEAAVETLTYDGLYNVDGKTLTDDIDLDSDEFYLLFTAVDQYGIKYKDYKNITINKATGTPDFHVTVAGGITNLKASEGTGAFKKITKDGKEYIGVKLAKQNNEKLKSGSASVMAIASNSGKSVTETIEVQAGNKARTISVSMPSVLAAQEETELNYTALDASGNEVTAYDDLKDIEISGGNNKELGKKNTDELYWKKDAKTGKAKLMFNGKHITNPGKNNKAYASYTFKTVDNKFSTVQLTISEQARPVAIAGLKSDVSNKLTPGTSREIKLNNLNIEDQYGRTMDDDALKTAIAANNNVKLAGVRITKPDGTDFTFTDTKNVDLVYNKDGYYTVNIAAYDDILFKVVAPSSDITASTTISLDLIAGDGNDLKNPLSTSNADIEFSTVKEGSIKDATVTIGTVFAPDTKTNDYIQKVVVKANGAVLSKGQYSVSVDGDLQVVETKTDPKDALKSSGVEVWGIKASDTQSTIFKDKDGNTLTAKVTVTLKNGDVVISKDVTISKVKPTLAKFELTKDNMSFASFTSGSSITVNDIIQNIINKTDGVEFDTLEDSYGLDLSGEINGTKIIASTTPSSANSIVEAFVKSYSDDSEYANKFRITFKDYDMSKVSVSNNGTSSATITKLNKDATITAVITIGNSDVTASLTITGK